ncbi:MAG: hypothetical protein ACRDOM_08630 [Nocardioides sp.]
MSELQTALNGLVQAVDAPRLHGRALGNWRWTVRQRMAEVRDLLLNEADHPADGWLAARGGAARRERTGLLMRLTELGGPVLESPDVERVRSELQRLLADIVHHIQRLHDLAYDEVELELGGSE